MEQGINMVLVTGSTHLRNALARIISEASENKILPAKKSTSESATRFHYAPALSEFILNTASARMQDVLGPHCAVLALKTADRLAMAKRAQAILGDYNALAFVDNQAQPEFPAGFITFVTCPKLNGLAIMFWPRDEDVQDIIANMTDDERAKLPARLPWSLEDLV